MMVKFSLIRDYEKCTLFMPTKEMLNRFTVDMYDFKNKIDEEDDSTFQELIDIKNAI